MTDLHAGKRVDEHTGMTTTGHEWDGIEELNTPLPRWWLLTFYACIIWSLGYWVLYPAWPLISSHTTGILGYSSRGEVVKDIAAADLSKSAMVGKLAGASLEDILKTPELTRFALAQGKAAFGDNCAACHGAGGAGAKGYPNLNDDDWLWGGQIGDIYQTVVHGIRAADEQTRVSAMPAFGKDGILKSDEIGLVANYVRSLSKLPTDEGVDLGKGATVFAENCASCHGEDAKGNREFGAPNLTDGIWLYGPEKATIIEGIQNGRGAQMPAWGARLDDTTIKALAVYVHSLGGGEK